MNTGVDDVMVAYPLFQTDSGGSIPTSAHQLWIDEVCVETACGLCKKWHSRLPIIKPSNIYRNKYQVCYTAEYKHQFFAVAIWSSPVSRHLDPQKTIELRRMAICDSSPKNTASRMISVMIKKIRAKFPSLNLAVSYQDTEVHTGTIYKASGWTATQITKGADWNVSRDRDASQSTADKIRWEYEL